MMDITERLRDWAFKNADKFDMQLLIDAANEIERLRALAGAVSLGPSLRDIRDSKTTGC